MARIFLKRMGVRILEELKKLSKSGITSERYSEKPIAEAAIGAENPTISDNQPLKKPGKG